MAQTKKTVKKTTTRTNGRRRARRGVSNTAASAASVQETELLNLIMDPCNGKLVNGFGMSSKGIVQRFTGNFVPGVATDTAGYFSFDPAQFGGAALRWGASNSSGTAPGALSSSPAPGSTFLDVQSEWCSPVAACMEVFYTGSALNRSGLIAVGQAPTAAVFDLFSTLQTPDNVITMCQGQSPLPSSTVEIKWSPGLTNFVGGMSAAETDYSREGNAMFVAFRGVKMSDIVIRVTIVVEYTPKQGSGIPYPPVGQVIKPGTGERIVSALGSAGTWWNNLDHFMGGMARAARAVGRYGPAAATLLGYGGAATMSRNLMALTM